MDAQTPEGLVLGTEQGASTPLAFWTYVDPSRYLQLDDVVHVRSPLPDGQDVDFYGVVDELRAVQRACASPRMWRWRAAACCRRRRR